ncbi:hypothetical protein VTK56DRAFT_8129 [Thermocarpiscus australiensis]
MSGWCQSGLAILTDLSTKNRPDTREFIFASVPDVISANIDIFLSLYPVSDFVSEATATLFAEFFHAARVIRDILMTCQPTWVRAAHRAGGQRCVLEWNPDDPGAGARPGDKRDGLGPHPHVRVCLHLRQHVALEHQRLPFPPDRRRPRAGEPRLRVLVDVCCHGQAKLGRG